MMTAAAEHNRVSDSQQQWLADVLAQSNQIILGKDRTIRLALACLIGRGHLLIEDKPGVGKTILAHALAKTLGLGFQRIQFTSDLLPGDVLGSSVYIKETGRFEFHAGPIFSQLVLADEINRATARTQSALLEAMEEDQVTIEGKSRPLPCPFFVIATQNPLEQVGTYPLPESQLDRFMLRISLGHPDRKAERELLKGEDRRALLLTCDAVITAEQVQQLQHQAEQVIVADPLLHYLQNMLDYSRTSNEYGNGLSPRAGLAVLHAARAWALIDNRMQVIPEDVQAVLASVIDHRLPKISGAEAGPDHSAAARLVTQVPIP